MEQLTENSVYSPFVLVDENFRVLDCNDHFQHNFAVEPGEDILEIFSGTDSLQLVYNFVHSDMDNFVFEHVISDGKWFSVHLQKVKTSGRKFCSLYFIPSEQKKIIESKINNFHNVIEHGGIPVAVSDENLKIVFVSGAFEDTFKSSLDKVYNTHVVSFFSKFMSVDEQNEMREHLSCFRSWKKTIILAVNNYYELRFIPVKDIVFNFNYYVIAVNDISQYMLYQKQLQEAYKKELHLNQLKTAFLENMSHEIRTPLNAVIGYSQIINDCIESSSYEEIKDFSDAIKDVLKRVMVLFNNIVEFSQIETGEIILDKDEINLSEVLRGVLIKKQKDADNKNVNLCYFNKEETLVVFSDWVKLEKIFLELTDNAIKFTDRGEVIIKVEKLGSFVNIIFMDTGRGMSETEIDRLLQPFEQGENGYTRSNQGAGLGLSIAYGLTKLLGGTFHIKTVVNSGTKIQVQFPIFQRN